MKINGMRAIKSPARMPTNNNKQGDSGGTAGWGAVGEGAGLVVLLLLFATAAVVLIVVECNY